MKAWETLIKEAFVQSTPQGSSTNDLAAKHGVPFINGKSNAGCPGIMDPIGEQPAIELQWGSGFANADKTGRFEQFKGALRAVEAYSNDLNGESNKILYTNLNVYGRAIFANIVNLKDESVKANIFSKVSSYVAEGLNLNGTVYKDSIKVGAVFTHYVSPKVEPYKNLESKLSSNNDSDLNEVIVADDSVETKEKTETKEVKKDDNSENVKIATMLIDNMLSKKIADLFISQSSFDTVTKFVENHNLDCPAYNNLLNDIVDGKVEVAGADAFI